jgi:hypothetical protein
MTEEDLRIVVDDGVVLEARLAARPGAGVAVLCHPHPLYGGCMDNNVVLAARNALAGLGKGTVRFNFRGVGRSTGTYDEGRGEVRDLEAVFQRFDDHTPRDLVAYSFGAWVALRAVQAGLAPDTLCLVSPPVSFMEFSGLGLPTSPTLIVAGDRDEFCRSGDLRSWLAEVGADASSLEDVTLAGADHFYSGRERSLGDAIAGFYRGLTPRAS